MVSISDFINPGAGILPQTSVGLAREAFARAPDRHALGVVENGLAVGLVTRDRVLTSADMDQPVSAIMDAEPPIFAPSLDVMAVCNLIAQDTQRSHDCFLVGDGDICLGAGSLRGVLNLLSHPPLDESIAATVAAVAAADAEGDLCGAPFKREFLDLVSGELAAPVAAVLAMTERLERAPLGVDALLQVRTIREAAETLNRIVAAAVDLTRGEQGILTVECEPVRLRGVIDDLQKDWTARATRSGVTLLASFDGDPELSAITDPHRLRQVFDCLVEAALNSARHGAVEVSLKAHADEDGVRIEGRVRDTGPGLPPDRLARIFEPLSKDSIGGGLGVALARQIVLGLHGCIRAESNVGAGVSMIFDILCDPAPVAKDQPAQATPVGASAAHILVVDDNATNRMVAEALCEMFDCTSECVVDGVEAVDIARSGRFDVILMDIKMPRMDGMTATRAIRALSGAAGQVPIIALTANADPDDARAYLACGMCAVVEKPIKPDRLLQAINDALAASASERRAAAA